MLFEAIDELDNGNNRFKYDNNYFCIINESNAKEEPTITNVTPDLPAAHAAHSPDLPSLKFACGTVHDMNSSHNIVCFADHILHAPQISMLVQPQIVATISTDTIDLLPSKPKNVVVATIELPREISPTSSSSISHMSAMIKVNTILNLTITIHSPSIVNLMFSPCLVH